MTEEHQKMREMVALAYAFALYKQYAEKEAAGILSIDLSTLKRWRRKGLVQFVPFGDGGVRYLGIHIADIILKGTSKWQDATLNENSASASISSDNAPEAKPGIDAGRRDALPSASASAQRILRKQSKG